MRALWHRLQLPSEARLNRAASEAFRAANPSDRAKAVEGMKRLTALTRALAERAGIAPPLVAVEGAESEFESSYNYADSAGFLSVRRRPALYVNPIFIEGLQALSSRTVCDPALKLTDDELYAVLAHEVAHLACAHHWQHAKMKPSEHKDALMRDDENEADVLAASYGASAKAFASATLKITRQMRMRLYDMAEALGEDLEEVRPSILSERMTQTWRTLEGGRAHPSFRERYERMKKQESLRVNER